MLLCTMSTCQTTAGCVCAKMGDEIEAERAASRRMILAARKQGADDAIRWLEIVEKYGVGIVPHALKELRALSAALSTHNRPTSEKECDG